MPIGKKYSEEKRQDEKQMANQAIEKDHPMKMSKLRLLKAAVRKKLKKHKKNNPHNSKY
jgi:ribosomal protein L24